MDNLTIEHILPFVEAHRYSGYFLLFLAMVLEGEVFLIIAGMLVHLGAFDVGDVFVVALVGVMAGNALWYFLGITLSEKNFMKPVIARAQKAVIYFLPNFSEKPFKSIFFSKFIYGANRATILMAGVLKVRFLLFLKAETLASLIWVTLYTSLGYFVGYAAVHLTHRAMYFALLALGFVVVFLLLREILVRFYERYKQQKNKTNHHA